MDKKELTAYDYLCTLAIRQQAFTKETLNLNLSHSDFPILVLSQLLGIQCISGTHAYGFLITKQGIDLVNKMYPNTLKKE